MAQGYKYVFGHLSPGVFHFSRHLESSQSCFRYSAGDVCWRTRFAVARACYENDVFLLRKFLFGAPEKICLSRTHKRAHTITCPALGLARDVHILAMLALPLIFFEGNFDEQYFNSCRLFLQRLQVKKIQPGQMGGDLIRATLLFYTSAS